MCAFSGLLRRKGATVSLGGGSRPPARRWPCTLDSSEPEGKLETDLCLALGRGNHRKGACRWMLCARRPCLQAQESGEQSMHCGWYSDPSQSQVVIKPAAMAHRSAAVSASAPRADCALPQRKSGDACTSNAATCRQQAGPRQPRSGSLHTSVALQISQAAVHSTGEACGLRMWMSKRFCGTPAFLRCGPHCVDNAAKTAAAAPLHTCCTTSIPARLGTRACDGSTRHVCFQTQLRGS